MKYFDLALNERPNYKYPIVLAKVGSQIHELLDDVTGEDENIEFLTTEDKIGMRVYKRSLIFLFLCTMHSVYNKRKVEILFPLGDAVYIECNEPYFQRDIPVIENMMKRIVEMDLLIKKDIVPLSDAIEYFKECEMNKKEELFAFRRTSSITLYELNGFKNYFYGDLVYSTGALSSFKLIPFKNGALLCYPNCDNPNVVKYVENHEKLYNKLYETEQWAKSLGAKTIGDLNKAIVDGKMDKIVLMQEAKAERDIANIAAKIFLG